MINEENINSDLLKKQSQWKLFTVASDKDMLLLNFWAVFH